MDLNKGNGSTVLLGPPLGAGRKVQLASLTSARFIAAFLVFGFHATVFLQPTPRWVTSVFGQGRAGVSFFFILSGFIITWNFREQSTGTFIKQRLIRLYPAYIAALILALCARLLTDPRGLRSGWATPFLLQSWLPSAKYYFAINVPAWSLSCEFFFYALTPLLMAQILRLSTRRLVGLATILITIPICLAFSVSAFGGDNLAADNSVIWLAYYFPPSRLPEYVLGMLGAVYVSRGGRLIPLRFVLAVTVSAYLLAAFAHAFGVVVVTLLPFALIIPAWAQRDMGNVPARFMNNRFFILLGECSYCFYLVHHIFVFRLSQPGFVRYGITRWTGALLSLVLSCVSAYCLHKGLEKPLSYVLRRRLDRRRSDIRPALTSSVPG